MRKFISSAVSVSNFFSPKSVAGKVVAKVFDRSSDDRPDFSFVVADDGHGAEATVFVHGYSAASSPKLRNELIRLVSAREVLPGHKKIVAFWDSGQVLDFTDGLLGTSADMLFSVLPPVALVRGRFEHFEKYKSRADMYSGRFIFLLSRFIRRSCPDVKRINLIGHSLGGRLVLRSLSARYSPEGFEIGDVLFMAAAVSMPGREDLPYLSRFVNGRMINAYSTSDNVLCLNYKESCLGSGKLRGLECFEMSGFGHSEYWDRLAFVLDKVGFSGHSK